MRLPVFIAVAGVLVQSAAAGQLDSFEEKAGKKDTGTSSSGSSSQSSSRSASDSSSFGTGTYPSSSGGSGLIGDLLTALVLAPFQYRHDDPAASNLSGSGDEEGWASAGGLYMGHVPGEATVPFVRVDYNWQYIDQNLEANDFRIEAGYKMLAFHGRHTVYTESNPSDELTMNQYYGVLRFGGALAHENLSAGSWELGIGLGTAQQQGNDEHSSWAFTVPVKLYPSEWFGLEFRPAWYRPQERVIGDYDLSASLGWRYVQLRGGYRWLWIQGIGHELNGPYAGVSVSF